MKKPVHTERSHIRGYGGGGFASSLHKKYTRHIDQVRRVSKAAMIELNTPVLVTRQKRDAGLLGELQQHCLWFFFLNNSKTKNELDALSTSGLPLKKTVLILICVRRFMSYFIFATVGQSKKQTKKPGDHKMLYNVMILSCYAWLLISELCFYILNLLSWYV